MTRTIIGPRAARPDVAPVGTQFYDSEHEIMYTYGENGWDDPTIKAEPKVAVKAPEDAPVEAPKPIRTAKTKKAK